MRIPTLEDISPTCGEDLDERTAIEHFLGKTQSEATALFSPDSTIYLGDFYYMGPKAFSYYMKSLHSYFLSERSLGDSDGLNTFIGIIGNRIEFCSRSICLCRDYVTAIIDEMISNYYKYDIDAEIYGDLESSLADLKDKVTTLKCQ